MKDVQRYSTVECYAVQVVAVRMYMTDEAAGYLHDVPVCKNMGVERLRGAMSR